MSFKKLGELTIDETPVAGSSNLIISGAVANLSNPNLLINGDFSINQRGQTSYTGNNKYTADRWQQGSGSFDYSTKTWTPTTQYSGFIQKVEDYEKFKGQTVTLSVKITGCSTSGVFDLLINDGSNHRTGTTISSGFSGIRTFTYTVSATATQLRIGLIYLGTATTDTISFEWIKAEIGEIATPFSPRPHAEELALCQRYYYKSAPNSILKTARSGYNFYDNCFLFKQTMRTAPTRTLHSIDGTAENLTKLSDSSNVGANTSYATVDSCSIQSNSGTLTANEMYVGYIELDAEIY